MPSRERIRIFFRRHQITDPTGNVVVVCSGENVASYEPGTVDQTWIEMTDFTRGIDKLNISWDFVNSNSSGDSTTTNPAGSNYDKGISADLIFNDAAFQFIQEWLDSDPCGILNSIDVLLTDEICKKRYRLFEIKADNIDEEPFGAPCEYAVKLREADPVWHCISKTFIWDNWQNWFNDGSTKHHPCFLTGIEARPRLITSARMGLSIFAHSIPLVSAIFNENDDAFRKIQNVDNFVDSPLVRDIISNVCDKCGVQVDTMFHDPTSPYYNLTLFYPLSGAMHESAASAVTSPNLWFHFANRWDITLPDLLDKLKGVFNAEWYVTPNNTLVFKTAAAFLNTPPIIDFTTEIMQPNWDPLSLRYTFDGTKKPAYGRYSYTIDASDLASQEIAPLYNDIIGFDESETNQMLEGNLLKTFEFAPVGAIRDGRAKGDYLRETVNDGETVGYALVILLAVIVASLLAGVLSAGAGAALAGFLAIWAANIAGLANDLRDLFGSVTYTGAVRLTSEQVGTPRLIIWDGVSMNRAKMVSIAPDAVPANTYYNPTSIAYTTRNPFPYGPAGIFNYPMFFDSYYSGNLFDRFHDALDNPLKSLATHKTFELDAYLCCELQDALGVWEDDFAKIGYFITMQDKGTYLQNGRIEHFELDYDREIIQIKGTVFKISK